MVAEVRPPTFRGLLLACVAAVLATIFGWWLHEFSHASIDRNRDKAASSRDQESSKQSDRQVASAVRQLTLQAAALEKAVDKTAETQQLAEMRQELQEERDKAEGFARDLASARREIELQAAALKEAAGKAADVAEVRQALQGERDKAEGFARDLAIARREIESQAAALKDSVNKQKLAELQQALQQSEARRKELEVRSQTASPLPKSETLASRQSPIVVPQSPEEHFMARARQLVEQGNISAARSMLERAVEGGNARAIFALAETYDSNMLSTWGTVGVQGDFAKAKGLYGKALAGGVEEADARLKALRP